MLGNKLICGVLALKGASAIALEPAPEEKSAAETIKHEYYNLYEDIPTTTWTDPGDSDPFDLGDALGDFYGSLEKDYAVGHFFEHEDNYEGYPFK